MTDPCWRTTAKERKRCFWPTDKGRYILKAKKFEFTHIFLFNWLNLIVFFLEKRISGWHGKNFVFGWFARNSICFWKNPEKRSRRKLSVWFQRFDIIKNALNSFYCWIFINIYCLLYLYIYIFVLNIEEIFFNKVF